MAGHVATSHMPLGGRVRGNKAIFAGGVIVDFLAAFTLFNDSVACAAIKLATLFAHKETLVTFSYACTNHFNHILSLILYPNLG
jgi:hypothetical protein